MKTNMAEPKEQNDLEIIKKLLIVQLILSGVSIREIKKITGMSNNALYQFLPKNLEKKK